jgi:hypothetical protein
VDVGDAQRGGEEGLIMHLMFMDGQQIGYRQMLYPKQAPTMRHLVRQRPVWEQVMKSTVEELRRAGNRSPAHGFRFKGLIHAYTVDGGWNMPIRQFPNRESFEMWMMHCGRQA